MSLLAADVRLAGRSVGTLTYERGGSAFTYQDDLADPSHQVLGQTFEDDPLRVRRVRTGLPPWFANLLPEGELRRQIVSEMGGGRVSDYSLLLRLGEGLPGAVTVHGDMQTAEAADQQSNGSANGARETPDHPLRYSLAGVQLKYSVHSDRLTAPASGEDSWWIVKLPDRQLLKLGENEYVTMGWLRDAGFDVPKTALLPAGKVGGLPSGLVEPSDVLYLIERFDRVPGGRVHVEDFAQLADVPPKHKYSESGATYDSMATTVLHLVGDDGLATYLSRLVAMVVIGNTDAHLKNWAVTYPDGRTPTLAPVYDFHSLTVYRRFRYAPAALSLAHEQALNLIGRDHLLRLARTAGGSPSSASRVIRHTIERLRDAWGDEGRDRAHEYWPELARHYESRLASLPLAQT